MALKHFIESLRVDDKNFETALNIAQLYEKLENIAKAYQFFERVASLSNDEDQKKKAKQGVARMKKLMEQRRAKE